MGIDTETPRKAWIVRLAIATAITLGSSCLPAAAQAPVNVPAPETSAWWRAYLAGSKSISLPDGRQLNLYCEGVGGPTVVMESGLGSGAFSWRGVQHRIAAMASVCVYDRAGYFGRSTPARGPRSAGAEAEDLSALLQAAHLKPPYVLVGHSYGGYIVRLYAYRHLSEIAGLVLLDPSSEHQSHLLDMAPASVRAESAATDAKRLRCAGAARPAGEDCVLQAVPADLPTDLKAWFVQAQDAAYANTVVRESAEMPATSSEQITAERQSLGTVPVVVLERDLTLIPPNLKSTEVPAFVAMNMAWHDLHVGTLAGISTNLSLRSVAGAHHRIHDDAPDVVIDAIREVMRSEHRR